MLAAVQSSESLSARVGILTSHVACSGAAPPSPAVALSSFPSTEPWGCVSSQPASAFSAEKPRWDSITFYQRQLMTRQSQWGQSFRQVCCRGWQFHHPEGQVRKIAASLGPASVTNKPCLKEMNTIHTRSLTSSCLYFVIFRRFRLVTDGIHCNCLCFLLSSFCFSNLI